MNPKLSEILTKCFQAWFYSPLTILLGPLNLLLQFQKGNLKLW